MKSDNAKRAGLLRDLLLDYDPTSKLEPGYPTEGARDAQLNPYFYAPVDPLPGQGQEEEEPEEGPGPMSTRLALAKALMRRD